MRFRLGHKVRIFADWFNSQGGFFGTVDYISEGTYIITIEGQGWHAIATDDILQPYWYETVGRDEKPK